MVEALWEVPRKERFGSLDCFRHGGPPIPTREGPLSLVVLLVPAHQAMCKQEVALPRLRRTSIEHTGQRGAMEKRCPGKDVIMPMPTGRMEKRIVKAVILEICLYDEPGLKERTITENVSSRGARVLVEREWRPRQQVLVISPNEGVRSRGRIVYCERVAEGRFAVGLELSVGAERKRETSLAV